MNGIGDDMANLREKYAGCMLGLAIGDALGGPTEFVTYDRIRVRYPPDGVRDFVGYRGLPPGSYTDDTEMTMALAYGLLSAADFEFETIMQSVASEFIKWGNTVSGSRAPGNTCMSSVKKLASGIHWSMSGKNNSNGCGAVMRTAPVGLVFRSNVEMLTRIARGCAEITHGHPAAGASSIAASYIVARLIEGESMEEAVDGARAITRGLDASYERAMNTIEQALGIDDEREAYRLLGDGWVAEEALANAIYVALKYDTYEDAILAAANSGGDTDSKACIAGAFMGAKLGRSAIPAKWVENVENGQELMEIAHGLLALSQRVAEV